MSNKRGPFFYITRIIGAAIILGIYLIGLRPVRRAITQQIALPIVSPYFNDEEAPYTIVNKGTALTLSFSWENELKTIRYQPQLGFFFLVACMALLFITLKLRRYLYLIGFHIIAMFIVIGLLFISRGGWYLGFIILDFLVTYLIPGLSFAYVALVYHLKAQSQVV